MIAKREPAETSSVNAARPSTRAIGRLSRYRAEAAPRGRVTGSKSVIAACTRKGRGKTGPVRHYRTSKGRRNNWFRSSARGEPNRSVIALAWGTACPCKGFEFPRTRDHYSDDDDKFRSRQATQIDSFKVNKGIQGRDSACVLDSV